MNKVIFLVGPPRSGKDIIVKEVFNNYSLNEFTLEQTKLALTTKINENDKKYSILRKESFIISTNAYNFDDIKSVKLVLEELGFITSMIFVNVSEEECFKRFATRHNITESELRSKFRLSKQNLNRFKTLFDNFIEYDNSVVLEDNVLLNPIKEFVDFFLYKNIYQLFENKKSKSKSRSLQKKLLDKIGDKLGTSNKISSDNISTQDYKIRNSGMGFPSTVGPMYNESVFSSDFSDLPAFTAPERSIPPEETSKGNPSVIAKIKTIANNKFKKKKYD
jgi:predicted kinase